MLPALPPAALQLRAAPRRRSLRTRCESEERSAAAAASELSGNLLANEELAKLAKAQARLTAAQAAAQAFDAALAAGSDVQAAQQQAERSAEAELAAATSAQAAAEAALVEAAAARDAAQQAAKLAGVDTAPGTAERVESVKAALCGALVGVLVAGPVAVAHFDGLALGAAVSSAALFGAVYRQTWSPNVHQRGGVVAAFGLTRGLAEGQLFLPSALAAGVPAGEAAAQAAALLGEAVLLFALAAAAMDSLLSRGLLAPRKE